MDDRSGLTGIFELKRFIIPYILTIKRFNYIKPLILNESFSFEFSTVKNHDLLQAVNLACSRKALFGEAVIWGMYGG